MSTVNERGLLQYHGALIYFQRALECTATVILRSKCISKEKAKEVVKSHCRDWQYLYKNPHFTQKIVFTSFIASCQPLQGVQSK